MTDSFDYSKKQLGAPSIEMRKYCGTCKAEILMPDGMSHNIGWHYFDGKYICNKCDGDIFDCPFYTD